MGVCECVHGDDCTGVCQCMGVIGVIVWECVGRSIIMRHMRRWSLCTFLLSKCCKLKYTCTIMWHQNHTFSLVHQWLCEPVHEKLLWV